MNQTLWTIIKGTLMEGDKGSGKAVCAFITMAIIGFICVFPTLHNKSIDTATLLELLGFIAALYGIKGYTAIQSSKNTPPVNPTSTNS
jgi:hypothetical protein